MAKKRVKTYPRSQYSKYALSARDEEKILVQKLLKSVAKIVGALVLTILILQLFGPKIFSVFGLLSLDRFKKDEVQKVKTNPPFFSDLPKATKDKEIDIQGFADSGSEVSLFVNGPKVATVTADGEGKFFFDSVSLVEGQNLIFAKATKDGKEESDSSQTIYLIYDIKKPEIVILSPNNGEEIASVDSRVLVSGTVNEESTVLVNTHFTVVDASGNFQTQLAVTGGENIITVTAKDLAGNEATSSIKIIFEKR